ncbi:MAG: hypothetical protein Q9219_004884 [cf. Caloplaca sp. 3 TL-2023]
MAPGGDWLARKILGNDLVEDVDRRNAAAEGAWRAVGKRPPHRHIPSNTLSSRPSDSYQRAPTRREGDGTRRSQHSCDPYSDIRHSDRGHARSGEASQRPSPKLLHDPYGVSQGAADPTRSVNGGSGSRYQQGSRHSHPAPGSQHYPAASHRSSRHSHASHHDDEQVSYKGHDIAEASPRSSRRSADVHRSGTSRHGGSGLRREVYPSERYERRRHIRPKPSKRDTSAPSSSSPREPSKRKLTQLARAKKFDNTWLRVYTHNDTTEPIFYPLKLSTVSGTHALFRFAEQLLGVGVGGVEALWLEFDDEVLAAMGTMVLLRAFPDSWGCLLDVVEGCGCWDKGEECGIGVVVELV